MTRLLRHAEERLYNGFAAPQDEARMVEFHDADWTNRLAIVQSPDDKRLRFFGLRVLNFEARSVLPEALRRELERSRCESLILWRSVQEEFVQLIDNSAVRPQNLPCQLKCLWASGSGRQGLN